MVFNLNNSISITGKGSNAIYEFVCPNCNCGFFIKKDNIYKRKTNMCIKCSSLIGLNKINIKPKYQGLLTKIKNSARKKNIDFDLNLDDLLKFVKIDKCTYCENTIYWNSKNSNRYNLDRMDNSKGYTKDNLVVCCWNCNNTKSNRFTHSEFIKFKPVLINIMKERRVEQWISKNIKSKQ